jgi:methionine-rich copper-binding protein CopC
MQKPRSHLNADRSARRRGAPGHVARVLWTVLFAMLCATAAAHTRLIGSVPPDGAELPAGARAVTLEFSEPVQPRFSDFAVHFVGTAADAAPSADNRLPGQEPVVDAARRRVDVPLPGTPQAGWYVLAWEVLADDGHRIEGNLRFRIAP